MTNSYDSHLIDALRSAMAADDDDLSADLAKLMIEHGIEITLEVGDQEDDDMGRYAELEHTVVESTITYRLLADGEELASLTRRGKSHYTTPCSGWKAHVAKGDRWPSYSWRAVIDAAEIDDDSWDSVPEAEEPAETAEDVD